MGPSSKLSAGGLLLLGGLSAGCWFEPPPVLMPYDPIVFPLPDAGSVEPRRRADAGTDAGFTRDVQQAPPTDAPPPVGAFSLRVPATQTPAVTPPAISGGTLLVARDGRIAVASDPDRDRVCFGDLTSTIPLGCVALEAGDEPGRIVEDGARRVHVALRRGGAVVSLDLATRAIVSRRAVCPAPRGVAYDPATRLLHVACAGGELVSLPADGGAETRRVYVDRDLRDVVVQGDGLVVSRFRSADLLTLNAAGTITRRVRPANVAEAMVRRSVAIGGQTGVAWRTIAAPGGVVVLHQRALSTSVAIGPGGYGGGEPTCQTGVVQGALSAIGSGTPVATPTLSGVALAVDVALSSDGARAVVVIPGNSLLAGASQVLSFTPEAMAQTSAGRCAIGTDLPLRSGQAVAVAMTPDNRAVVQTREPSTLVVENGVTIQFGGEGREDTGHRLFHSNAGAFVACASCHPEGGDDAHVWNFSPIGARRTQNLHGGLVGTAPFHWDGDMPTFERLAAEVFAQRMSGGRLRPDQVDALERWSTTQPAIPTAAPQDMDAVARGRAVFEEPTVGCATCHAGEHLTNNVTVDVGTGGAFQVPSLRGVAWRTPLLHNGCAATLRDRFGACGGGDRHGHTSHLLAEQISDLVAYLETL